MKSISFNCKKPTQYYKNVRIMADTGLHEKIADIIQSFLNPGSVILDYGAGEGALTQRLMDLGYQMIAADINKEDFKAATTFIEIDFNDINESQKFFSHYKNKFDLVLGVEVIEHVENPWQYIRDIKELIKPGGYLLISTPNVTSWYSRIEFFFKGRLHQFEDSDLSYGHINPIFQNEIRLICAKNDLIVQEIIPAGWLPRLWISKSIKRTLINLLGFIGSFFMRGIWDGWCIIAVIKKP